MTDERLIIAIGRLERAVARLERLDARAVVTPDAAALHARHMRLRESTQAAIARLDDLLGSSAAARG